MGFLMFVVVMLAICAMTSTPKGRAEWEQRIDKNTRWLWWPTLAILLSFIVF